MPTDLQFRHQPAVWVYMEGGLPTGTITVLCHLVDICRQYMACVCINMQF